MIDCIDFNSKINTIYSNTFVNCS